MADETTGSESSVVTETTNLDTQNPPEGAHSAVETSSAGSGTGESSSKPEIDSIVDENEDAEAEEEANIDAVEGYPPEGYVMDNLVAPEGLEVDKATFDQLANIGKELNLPQKAIDTIYNKMMPFLNERQNEQLYDLRASFIAEAKADAEMGGRNWENTKASARKALYQFTDGPTRELLAASGLDCHPGFIRAFYQISKAISNDAVVTGQRAEAKRDPAQAFFYNSKMN